MSTVIERYADTDALVTAAGDRLVAAINSAIATRGQATIVLTGGGTGIGLLKRVGERSGGIGWRFRRLSRRGGRFCLRAIAG